MRFDLTDLAALESTLTQGKNLPFSTQQDLVLELTHLNHLVIAMSRGMKELDRFVKEMEVELAPFGESYLPPTK